jgi:hypothetical protein
VCVCVFVTLVIQHETCMRHIILSSVACLAVPYFSTLSHKWYYFLKKKVIEHKKCVLILSTPFVWNDSNSRNSARHYHKCTYASCKVPVTLVIVQRSLNFLDSFSTKSSNIIFHKNPYSGSRTVPCAQTDKPDEANSRSSQFCECA